MISQKYTSVNQRTVNGKSRFGTINFCSSAKIHLCSSILHISKILLYQGFHHSPGLQLQLLFKRDSKILPPDQSRTPDPSLYLGSPFPGVKSKLSFIGRQITWQMLCKEGVHLRLFNLYTSRSHQQTYKDMALLHKRASPLPSGKRGGGITIKAR